MVPELPDSSFEPANLGHIPPLIPSRPEVARKPEISDPRLENRQQALEKDFDNIQGFLIGREQKLVAKYNDLRGDYKQLLGSFD